MKKLSILALSICALTVVACSPPTPEEEQIEQLKQAIKVINFVEKDITGYMFYVIDPRTGLCFARSQVSKSWYVYTPVDCTDRVMENVINKQR